MGRWHLPSLVAGSIAASYAGFAFALMEWNPAAWGFEARGGMVLAGLTLTWFGHLALLTNRAHP